MKIAALISGGKDSIFSVQSLMKLGHSISHFICLTPENKDSYMFHSVNINIVKYISYSCGIPLVDKKTNGIKEEELIDLENIILKLKEKNKIDGICSGAIQSTYQKNRIDKICKSLNLVSLTPLWNANLKVLLTEMIKYMDIRIVSVSANGFDESYLGKKLTLEMVNKLEYLSLKYGINIVGEGGEFETIVLDSPIYKYKIKIIDAEIKWFKNYGNYYISKVKLIDKKNII